MYFTLGTGFENSYELFLGKMTFPKVCAENLWVEEAIQIRTKQSKHTNGSVLMVFTTVCDIR